MSIRRHRGGITGLLLAAFLLATCGGLGWIGWTRYSMPIDTAPKALRTSGTALDIGELAVNAVSFTAKPLSSFGETGERPLFSDTRRRLPKKVAVKKPVAKESPPPKHAAIEQLHLIGVVAQGESRLVLIQSPQSPDGSWHKAGDVVAGWEIIEISSDSARLETVGKSADLSLYVDNAGITRE